MIYLKRILKVILGFILTLIFIISLPITVLSYPFYLMIYYVVYGELGVNLDYIVGKIIDVIFKPLDLF